MKAAPNLAIPTDRDPRERGCRPANSDRKAPRGIGMASPSAVVNTSLRTHVVPVLREAGFEKVDARNVWAWRDHAVWVFNIRAVGPRFSEVTGWPPSSLTVWLGVLFTFAPDPPRAN
jgi:hypothetical protein